MKRNKVAAGKFKLLAFLKIALGLGTISLLLITAVTAIESALDWFGGTRLFGTVAQLVPVNNPDGSVSQTVTLLRVEGESQLQPLSRRFNSTEFSAGTLLALIRVAESRYTFRFYLNEPLEFFGLALLFGGITLAVGLVTALLLFTERRQHS
jgi:hypothetical protein